MFGTKFLYKDSNGAFIGPFAPLLYTPNIIHPYFETIKAIGNIPGLPPTARELVILGVGSVYKSVYELYAHERVASGTDLTEAQIADAKNGKVPGGLNDNLVAAYEIALKLAKTPGPLPREDWDRIEKAFGREGALAVTHYVGIYAYTCILLNATDIPVPEGEKL